MNHFQETLALKPSRTDVTDPLYCRKYAHNMVPLIAYRCRPIGWDRVNKQGDDNRRQVYFGWNNVTDYEQEGINKVVRWLQETKQTEVPPGFGNRNLLKFCQANFF